MDKKFYKDCIDFEVYKVCDENQKVGLIRKIWNRYFCPQTNSVFFIRKMQYYYSKSKNSKLGFIYLFLAQNYRLKLYKRYLIDVWLSCKIGKGLKILHPISIVIGRNAKIGENFTIFQNCTIGLAHKSSNEEKYPIIGNNVTMYANSAILGPGNISDNVIIGMYSMLIGNAEQAGTYVGIPAKRVEKTAV